MDHLPPLLRQANLLSYLHHAWYSQSLYCETLPPTGAAVCAMYLLTIDCSVRLNAELLARAIALAGQREGRTPPETAGSLRSALEQARTARSKLDRALAQAPAYRSRKQAALNEWGEALRLIRSETLQPPAGLYTSFLLELLLGVEGLVDDKLRLDWFGLPQSLDLLDFLADLVGEPRAEDVHLGGAAGHIAALFSEVAPEANVVVWARFLSHAQAKTCPDGVRFLDLGSTSLEPRPIQACGGPDQPEVRNYPFEFDDEPVEVRVALDGQESALEVRPAGPGRVIAISPGYLYFTEDRHVARDRAASPPLISRLLAGPDGRSRIPEVAGAWPYWILINLQRVSDPAARESLEDDLALVPESVTIHTELSDPRINPWYKHVLCTYVGSLGVNGSELPDVVLNLPSPSCAPPPPGSTASDLFDQAVWLAHELDVDRLYVHGHQLDFVVRRDPPALLPDSAAAAMEQEVRAALFAKARAICCASGAPLLSLTRGRPGLPQAAIAAMLDLYISRVQPVDEHGYLAYEDTVILGRRDLERGWFAFPWTGPDGSRACYSIAVIPVSWMEDTPADVTTTGLGDKASAISFVYGGYTVPLSIRVASSVGADCTDA